MASPVQINAPGITVRDDGTVYDANTGTEYESVSDFLENGDYDYSLSSQDPNPPMNPSRTPDAQTSNASGWLNSAGQFGVAIASIISGKPVVVSRTGQPVGAVGSRVVAPPASSQLLTLGLVGLGVFMLIKVLAK